MINTEEEPKPAKRKRKTTAKAAQPDNETVNEAVLDEGRDSKASAASNNNERILKLNAEGKSVVEIAKELGLGIGEVKLVIDLFRGGK